MQTQSSVRAQTFDRNQHLRLLALILIFVVICPAAYTQQCADCATNALVEDPVSSGEWLLTKQVNEVSVIFVAVRKGKALAIEYYSASHDMLSSRVVDPIRVALVADHSYLEAWCRSAEGVRLFRFDRIVDAAVLDEPSAPPEPAIQAPPDTSLFDADPSLPSARLRLAPEASWMFEYYPMRLLQELPNGYCEAAMTYASEDWMARQVLGLGSAVRVLGPDSLATRVADDAAAALEAYQAAARSG